MDQNLFKGLNEAKTYAQGTFLEPGLYTLEVTNCLAKDLRTGGNAFIVEAKILDSSNPKHPVGSKASWFQGFKEREVAFAAIKLFMYAILGKDPQRDKDELATDVDPKLETYVTEAVTKNALAGQKVKCQVSMKNTKKGTPFSLHTFSPASA